MAILLSCGAVSTSARQQRNVLRFWGRNTRGQGLLAKLKIRAEMTLRVVAEFFEVYEARYRDAFCPNARSHRAITTLSELCWPH